MTTTRNRTPMTHPSGVSSSLSARATNGNNEEEQHEASLPAATAMVSQSVDDHVEEEMAVPVREEPDREQRLRGSGLPAYGALPACLLSALPVAADSVSGSWADSGADRLSWNLETVTWECVADKDLILIPLQYAPGPLGGDFAQLERCGMAVFVVRGKPARLSTYCRLVGYYGSHVEPVSNVRIGQCFAFGTPEAFLRAREDLAAFCAELREALPLIVESEKRHRDEDGDNEHRHRRPTAQGEGALTLPASDSSQGERSPNCVYDADGGAHFTRVRTDIGGRERDLVVSFRAISTARGVSVRGAEYILQASEYREEVGIQSKRKAADRAEGFRSCGLLDRCSGLLFYSTTDTVALEKLLKGLFGGHNRGYLRMQDFSSRGEIPRNSSPCPVYNAILADALKNMEVVLRVFYDAAYVGALGTFIDCLEGEDRPFDLAPSGFLLDAVEGVLTEFFRRLRSSEKQPDLRGPEKCALALRGMFDGLVKDNDSRAKLTESVTAYDMHELREKAFQTSRPPTSRERILSSNKIKQEGGGATVCPYDFASQLGIRGSKLERFTCRKGAACPFKHKPLGGMPKAEMLAIVANFPPGVKEHCMTAISQRRFK